MRRLLYSIAVLYLSLTIAKWAQGDDDDTEHLKESLLRNLQSYDRLYSASITVHGIVEDPQYPEAPYIPVFPKDLVYTQAGDRFALLESASVDALRHLEKPANKDALGIAYDGSGNMAMSIFTRSAWSFEGDRASMLKVATVFLVSPEHKILSQQDNQTITYYPPDASQLKAAVCSVLWTLGRGYAAYIDEIIEIQSGENGLLKATCSGTFDGRAARGRWILNVDPNSQFIVRSAEMFLPYDAKKASVTISNESIQSEGPCVYPKSGGCDLLDGGKAVKKFGFKSVLFNTDESVLKDARRQTDGADLPRTTVDDHRPSPPTIRYVDKDGNESGGTLRKHKSDNVPMTIAGRNRTLLFVMNALVFLCLVVFVFWRRRSANDK